MTILKGLAAASALAICAAGANPAHAVTQCEVNVLNIWAGDGGSIWLNFTNGGSTYLTNTNPNREAVIALATTALVGSRRVIVRYAADNVSCTASDRSDFVGLYLF